MRDVHAYTYIYVRDAKESRVPTSCAAHAAPVSLAARAPSHCAHITHARTHARTRGAAAGAHARVEKSRALNALGPPRRPHVIDTPADSFTFTDRAHAAAAAAPGDSAVNFRDVTVLKFRTLVLGQSMEKSTLRSIHLAEVSDMCVPL